jgi:hypothetical protein
MLTAIRFLDADEDFPHFFGVIALISLCQLFSRDVPTLLNFVLSGLD